MAIKSLNDVLYENMADLAAYQSGQVKPVPTGREWLDEIFNGLLPGDIVGIAGGSGAGKTHEVQELKSFIMDKTKNQDSSEFVWCDFSLEMRSMSTAVRDLNAVLKKSKKKILTEDFTEQEKEVVKDYYDNKTDGRFFIEEEVPTPDQFEEAVVEFLEEHKDKKAVFITIDHIALLKTSGDKKSAVDGTVEVINRVKKIYKNTFWFILSQLNRNIEGRVLEKNVNAMPNRGDIYQSDTLFQVCDYLYVVHNPYKLGIKAFGRVNKEAYIHLYDHFTEVKGNMASFDTLGRIFYIVLKMREAEPMFKNIYIKDLNIPGIERYRVEEEKAVKVTTAPKFDTPVVDMTSKPGSMNKFAGWDKKEE